MRVRIALSLALCALAASPAVAAPDAGKWSGGNVPPGQAKKLESARVRASLPVVDQVTDAVAGAAQPVVEPVAASVASAPAVPAITTPTATTAAAPAAQPAPAAAVQPKQASTGRKPNRSTGRSRSRSTSSGATANAAARARSVPSPARATAPRRSRPATPRPKAVTRSRAAARRTDPPAKATGQDSASPIERTVVQVFEVIPAWLLIALAALTTAGLMALTAAVAQVRRARWLDEQRLRLAADVGVLQSALLPELPEDIGGARVTAAYQPAEGLAAGGDFYDAFELPDGCVGLLIGDVAGHGRDVVPLTGLVRYSLRAYLEAGLSPRATLQVASNVLASQVGGRMVTVAVATFDPATGRLAVACAGHWPPLLLGIAAKPVTACSSPPIGAGVPTGRRQTIVGLPAGAAACFHTDGLADAMLGSDRLGPDGVARDFRALGAHGGARELIDAIVRRSDHQPDDMAACILRAAPDGVQCPPLQLEELEVDAAAVRGGRAARFLAACGVSEPDAERAIEEAGETIARAGTAVIEVRLGTLRSDAYVSSPAAVALPVVRDARVLAAVG